MTCLKTELESGILLATLNRPEALNALNRGLLSEINELINRVESDKEVRVLVFTGAGPKAFCAGADISELNGLSENQAYEFMRFGQLIFNRIGELQKPVIAAVNGYALGGGCELALACDIRFASSSAKVGQPEIKLANIPGWGGTQRLPRIVGMAKAKELIFSGELITSAEALQCGLVNRVYPPEELVLQTIEYAKIVASRSAFALGRAKEVIQAGLEHGLKFGLEAEARAVGQCCTTDEQHEAVNNFLNKSSHSK
jgi:enoyl-CoA hydratase